VCDGIDQDCDQIIDEGVTLSLYADADGDGFGDVAAPQEVCELVSGLASNADDCDDSTANANPLATEVCDQMDNDCDGSVDEEVGTIYPIDLDGDGWGDAATTQEACAVPTGYAEASGDCDDTNAQVFPTAQEWCNTLDDDCDGEVDEADSGDASTWYADADADTYGDPAVAATGCEAPVGFVANAEDCDDSNFEINPNTVWYDDDDADGFGDALDSVVACVAPTSWVRDFSDCNDAEASDFPGATESCDGRDNDCDGMIDTDDPSVTGSGTWYFDGDADGYGDLGSPEDSCAMPADHVVDASDCDDANVDVHPAATEVCNALDDDCDGLIDDDDPSLSGGSIFFADADGDGYGDPAVTTTACSAPAGFVENGDDCDDSNPSLNTAASEVYDGVDNDCDGVIDNGVYGVDCADILDVYPTSPNGSYTIDPDGSASAVPFAVLCEMTIEGGGWTQSIQDYLDHLTTADDRRYLYTEGGAFYLSPATDMVWSWSRYQALNGTYAYAGSGTVSTGSFACTHAEAGDWGVGCSNGGGGTFKVLPIYSSDPTNALSMICQDQPDAFAAGACQADASIWSREE
jgi:hypothetical protein